MRSRVKKKRQSETLSLTKSNLLQTSGATEREESASSSPQADQATASLSTQKPTGFNLAKIPIFPSQKTIQAKSAGMSQHSFFEQTIQRETMPEEQEVQMKQFPDSRKAFFPAYKRREEQLQLPRKNLNPLIQAKLTHGVARSNYRQAGDWVVPELLQRDNERKIKQVTLGQQVQRQQEDEDDVQMKAESSQIQRHAGHHDEEDGVQMKAANGGSFTADRAIENKIKSSRGQGQSLDSETRSFMEPRFGASFAHVKVHTGSDAVQMNRDLHSQAFTQGNDIYFNQGKYNPDSTAGKQLLAHELTHTIQQTGGVSLQRHPVAGEEAELQQKPESGAHSQGCACHMCTGGSIQRQVNGNGATSNFLGQNLIQRISKVSPKEVQRQTSHGKGCSCPMCVGGVQAKLTVGVPGDKYEQEADRMAEKVMAMSDLQASGTKSIQRHGGHDHEEDMAQTKPLYHSLASSLQQDQMAQRKPLVNQVTTSPNGVIQRHSSHEHYLLGQTSPDDLATIPQLREFIEEKGGIDEIKKQQNPKDFEKFMALRDKARHVMKQHLTLLENFIKKPNYLDENFKDKAGEVKKDEDWEVPYISLPVKGSDDKAGSDSIVVLYGELNALPDYFGNPDAIANTKKKNVVALLQGLRQRVYRNLVQWYDESALGGRDYDNKTKRSIRRDQRPFAEAQGERRAQPGTKSSVDQLQEIEKLITEDGKKHKSEGGYAVLERNACHFAPYSWNAWKKYHTAALEAAQESADKMKEVYALHGQDQTLSDELYGGAKKKANEALVQNAFGDHYLQDSFAAGHLIDKTLVMQEFVKYLDANNYKMGDALDAKERWKMTVMIANSSGDSIGAGTITDPEADPQALHDKMKEDEKLDKNDRKMNYAKSAEFINLNPTEDIILMMWWREKALADSNNYKTVTASKLEKEAKADLKFLHQNKANLLEQLVKKKFVRKTLATNVEEAKYTLDQAQINVIRPQAFKRNKPYSSQIFQDTSKLDADKKQASYKNQAAEFNLNAYNAFMSNVYIQYATNFFHDEYCKNGLEVQNENGEAIGKIYGDRDMLKAGGSKGVKYSAETTRLSRVSVSKKIMGEPLNPEEQTDSIKARFPHKIKDKLGIYSSLANWNKKKFVDDRQNTFAEITGEAGNFAKRRAAKATYKKSGGLSNKNAINIELPAHAKQEGF